MGRDRIPGRDRYWALWLFVGGLLLRLIHLLTVRDSPFFSILYIDPLMYDEWAQRIAAGNLLSERPFFLDPLYPYLMGAIFAVFGQHYEAVVAVQSLLGALVPPLVFLAARDWFDRSTARVAGVMAVVYLPSIYFGGLIMKPGLSLFLVALALWLLARALRGAGIGVWFGAGLALGLAALTRGNLIPVVPVLGLWLLLRGTPEGADEPFARRVLDRRRWKEVTGFALGTALILAIPLAHNYAVGGELILSTANAGQNFFIGNNPTNSSGEYQQLPFVNANPKYEQRDFRAEAARRTGDDSMSDRDVSAFWFNESRKWIQSNPGAWTGLMWRKVRSFWGAFEIPDSLDYYLSRKHAPVLRVPLPGFGLLAPLGLLGAVLVWRRRGWPQLLVVFVATYSLSVIIFFVFSRFRMVAVPALYVFAGFGAMELYRRSRAALRRESGWAPALWTAGLFVVFCGFVNLPVRANADSWGYRLAGAIGLPTRLETNFQGKFNLGLAYAARAKDPQESSRWLALAETELRAALLEDPPYARCQIELGKVLSRQGRNRDAIEFYRQAAGIEPNDYKIYHTLGLLHRRLAENDVAEVEFRRALRLAPGHVASANRLGQVLLDQGKQREAAEAFHHALRVSPGDRTAIQGLRAAESGTSPGISK